MTLLQGHGAEVGAVRGPNGACAAADAEHAAAPTAGRCAQRGGAGAGRHGGGTVLGKAVQVDPQLNSGCPQSNPRLTPDSPQIEPRLTQG
jgi:hypothetical protein